MFQQWLYLIDYVDNFIFLFIYTQNILSSPISAQRSCLLCCAVSDPYWLNTLLSLLYRQTNSLHLHNVSFSLPPWGWRMGITGEGPRLKVIPSAQTTSFGCTSECHLLYLFIALMSPTSKRSYHMMADDTINNKYEDPNINIQISIFKKVMIHTILTTFSLIVWHKLLIIVRYLS